MFFILYKCIWRIPLGYLLHYLKTKQKNLFAFEEALAKGQTQLNAPIFYPLPCFRQHNSTLKPVTNETSFIVIGFFGIEKSRSNSYNVPRASMRHS